MEGNSSGDSSGSTKRVDVLALAQQLRAGTISKKELLESLSYIQKQKQVTQETEAKQDLLAGENALKKELIRKLIEEKRRSVDALTLKNAKGAYNSGESLLDQPSSSSSSPYSEQSPTTTTIPTTPNNSNSDANNNRAQQPQPPPVAGGGGVVGVVQYTHLSQELQQQQQRYDQLTQQLSAQVRQHKEQQTQPLPAAAAAAATTIEKQRPHSTTIYTSKQPPQNNNTTTSNHSIPNNFDDNTDLYLYNSPQPTQLAPSPRALPKTTFTNDKYEQYYHDNTNTPPTPSEPGTNYDYNPHHHPSDNSNHLSHNRDQDRLLPRNGSNPNIIDDNFDTPQQYQTSRNYDNATTTNPHHHQQAVATSHHVNNPQQALFERAKRRQEQKDSEFQRIKEELANLEMQPCTFQPSINQKSAAKRATTPVVERLYADIKPKWREWEQEKKKKE